MRKREVKLKRATYLLPESYLNLLEVVWQKERIKKSQQVELALKDYFEKKNYLIGENPL